MNKKSPCDIYRVEAIEAFRLGMVGQGSDALVRLMDALLPLLEANAAALGTHEVELLNHLAEAQQRGDYTFVADLLQYTLPESALASF